MPRSRDEGARRSRERRARPPAHLLVVGLSHHTAGVGLRERLTLTELRQRSLLHALAASGDVSEAVVLSTCNRTEVYVAADGSEAATRTAVSELAGHGGLQPHDIEEACYVRRDEEAVRHLFRVVSSLDSMVVGESEIQGQVRQARDLACGEGAVGPLLDRLFRHAIETGKRVRTETAIGERPISMVSVAVDLADRAAGGIAGRRALVVGAGRIAQAAARLLAAAGVAGLVVVNRTAEAASGLAARYGGAGAGLERLGAELAAADVVLACVGVPDPLVTRADLETAGAATARRGVVIVDLGVPRCVAPDAATVAGVTLHDVDAVERASGENVGGRRRECDAAEALVADEARRFAQWRRGLAAEPTLVSLRERAESIRRGEIARFEREWDALSPADHERVDTLTRAILNRLLHEPTVRARAAAERGEGGHLACLQDLFGLVS